MERLGEKYKTATIAGAGIMGLLVAWKLLKEGIRPQIVDMDDPDGKSSTSYFAGGMLSPISELEIADHKIHDLGMRSIDLWQEILADIDASRYLQKNGSLIVSHERDVPLLKRFAERIRATGFDAEIKHVDGDGIAELEPSLKGRFSVGYFIANEGLISPRDVLVALRQKLRERGVTFYHEQEVTWQGSELHTGLPADLTIDCRGIGAQDRFEDLRGVKGEIAIVRTPELRLNRPVRLMHPRYPLYIAPRDENMFLIGATQIETADMTAVSVRSALELLSALYALHPSFGEADIVELGTHLRPAFSDNDPHIFFEKDQMAINGLYRHGYLISPALACDAIDMLGSVQNVKDNQVA